MNLHSFKMSNSDSDYCHVGAVDAIDTDEISSSESAAVNTENGNRVRGKDIQWYEFCIFDSTVDFKNEWAQCVIKKWLYQTVSRENVHADTETFVF